MRRLICTFVVRIWLKQVFSWRGSYIQIYPNENLESLQDIFIFFTSHLFFSSSASCFDPARKFTFKSGSGNILSWRLVSWNHFYCHSLPTADSRKAVVSYWRKDVHLVLVNCLGNLPRNSVVRLTDRLDMTIVVHWDVKPHIKQTNFQAHIFLPKFLWNIEKEWITVKIVDFRKSLYVSFKGR